MHGTRMTSLIFDVFSVFPELLVVFEDFEEISSAG